MWILFHQKAPDDGTPWAVGYLKGRDISNVSWYCTEDEARLAHHRLMYGS